MQLRRLMVSLCLAAAALPLSAQQRKKPPALPELEARAARDSLDPSAHYELSLGYYRAKRYDDEARALRRAIAIDPRYAPAYYSLGLQVYDRRPKLWDEEMKRKVPPAWRDSLDRSYRLRRQAFLIDPMVDLRVVGTEAPSEEMMVIEDWGESTTDYLLYLAVAGFSRARYELSYAAMTKWLERAHPRTPRDSLPSFVFWYRGLAAAHQNSHRVAIADFRTLLDRALTVEQADSLIQVPLSTNDFRYILALLYERANQPADAVTMFKDALANDLGLYMAHVGLARTYRQFKMWNEAVAEAQRAIETNPDDATAQRELGEILTDAKKYAEAEAALKQAAERNPADVRVHLSLARLYQVSGRPADAKASAERFVAIAPSTWSGHVTEARTILAAVKEAP